MNGRPPFSSSPAQARQLGTTTDLSSLHLFCFASSILATSTDGTQDGNSIRGIDSTIISNTPKLENLKLSLIDQVLLTCHIPIILFYPSQLDSNLDRAQRSHQLKQSLSKLLTQFYPLAGRIIINSSVHCNDSGVPFLEA